MEVEHIGLLEDVCSSTQGLAFSMNTYIDPLKRTTPNELCQSWDVAVAGSVQLQAI